MHHNDDHVVSNFIVQALQGHDITICDDGRQTRSFCFMDDLVYGLLKMMVTDDAVIGLVNLGNPTEFTIAQLAALVLELTNSRVKIGSRPLPQYDPRQRCPGVRP